jgi:hypothetical protein
MLDQALATLEQSLRPHLPLSKDRRETLALLVVGMVSARTVDLSHIASERPGALVASTYRRLQRFFQHVELGKDRSAPWRRSCSGTTFPSPRISGIAAGPASSAAASPEWRPTRPS